VAVSPKQLTLAEFLDLPEEEPALEFENGRVYQKASPKGKHSGIQGHFVQIVNGLVEPPRVASAFSELRISFGGRSYVPDVAIYRWDRIPVDANGEVGDDFLEPPDVAVEIVSPDQSVTKLVRRCLWYVGYGAKAALLIDPGEKSILLFRPDQIPQSIESDGPVDLRDVSAGVILSAQELFDSLKVR
jgi:Uma2 family endonuclease